MVKVIWTKQSIEDINNIAEYISLDSARYAESWVEEIFDKEFILSTFPDSGRIVPELKQENIREIITGNYRLVYRTNIDFLEVLTVYHCSRLLSPENLNI